MTSLPERLSVALADRYRIERELGAGGMATVYLAYDLKHDRKLPEHRLPPLRIRRIVTTKRLQFVRDCVT